MHSSHGSPSDSLLASKLSRPRGARWLLGRPGLQAQLAQGLTRRLTALVARAGYGKTTTLSHFVEGSNTPHLWLQLDSNDNNPATFLPYLAWGIYNVLGGGRRLMAALEAGGPAERPLHLVVADLSDCPGDVVIVFDDFHHITSGSPVAELVGGLLQYAGERTHLFIGSRTALPFPTARLKVAQEAVELGENDLRFSVSDIRLFFRETVGMELDDTRLEQVSTLTEGWPAALVLAAAGLRRRGSVDALLAGGVPSDLFIYLAEEVWHALPDDLRRFAEESAVLDVCNPVACDAILNRTDSETAIGRVMGSDLLLSLLGPDSFRYHHLLQLFLQERLKARDGGKTFREICRRAGAWYVARDLPVEAAYYYLRGEWFAETAALVEQLASLWLFTSRFRRLNGLFGLLPAEVMESFPWITLCQAQDLMQTGHDEPAIGLARQALRCFTLRDNRRGVAQAALLIAAIGSKRREADTAREALALAEGAIEPGMRREEARLRQYRAEYHLIMEGPSEGQEEDFRKALEVAVEFGDKPAEAVLYDRLGGIRYYVGDYATAVKLLERSAEISIALGEPPHEVAVNLAGIYYRVGRFQDCVRVALPMLTESTRPLNRVHAAASLLQAYVRLSEFDKVMEMARVTHQLIEEMDYAAFRPNLPLYLSQFYRLSGKPQSAVKHANEAMAAVRHIEWSNAYRRMAIETILLHLFYTGKAKAAARLASRCLSRHSDGLFFTFERMMLTLLLAVAEFRQSKTESRPEAARLLGEGIAECRRRGFEFFALHEWPLALVVIIYGLAFRVEVEFCRGLLDLMEQRLPKSIRAAGIDLPEAEARLVPAAYRALEDSRLQEVFAGLLTPADRRRVANLAGGPAGIAIRCLGPLSVTVGAEPVELKALKRRKAGQLLILLLSSEHPIPRDQVVDLLWPDLDPAAADTSLRVALHHLRRLLEPHLGGEARSRYVQSERGLLWFSRQPEVSVDLDDFRTALVRAAEAAAAGKRAEAAEAYERAAGLYQSDLAADDPYTPALQDVRLSVRSRLAGGLDWLSHYYGHELYDHDSAIRVCQQRLALDRAYEPAHQALIRLYLAKGETEVAKRQYAACRDALAQLGAVPSRTTESLMHLD